ncbi:hypothetical protein Tsubulata_024279 [Turnera subulata]|uniref:DUF4283 domain-containing protein n=1 Tax=Turnera subulata TaxID=218843 RepID=A0A9Q0G9K7_9ROSI|nr:hypothetical protein Tsubulata_024279 [Turnera subulata]
MENALNPPAPATVTTPPHKPPDPPPDIRDTEFSEASVPRPSFLETLMRDQGRARARQPSVDLIEAQLVHMEFVNGNWLHPSFELEKEYFRQLCAPWRESLILKLLGRDIGYKALYSRLVHLWKLVGRYELLDLGHGCFLAKLHNSEDLERVIKCGLWVVQGHYLTVRQWFPQFRPESDSIDCTLAWVRLSSLPLMYYDDDLLETVALGLPIKIDSNTSISTRALYARMCVEIDLALPFVLDVTIRGEEFKVQYEGLHTICMTCGTYGHDEAGCKSVPARGNKVTIIDPATSAPMGEGMKQDGDVAPNTDFGDWMIARRIRRLPSNKPPAAESHSSGPSNGNRFAALSHEQAVDEENHGQPSVLEVSDVMRLNNPHPKRVRAEASPGPFSFSTSPKEQSSTSSQKEPASSPAQVSPRQPESDAILKSVPNRGESKVSRGPPSAPLVSSSPPLVSPMSSSLPPMAPFSSAAVGLPSSPPLVFGLAAFNPKASSAVLEPKPPDDVVGSNGPRFPSGCPPPGSPLESFVEASDQLGAGSRKFFQSFKYLYSLNKPDVVFLFELWISGDKAARVSMSLGFDSAIRRDPVGISSGMWVLWHSNRVQLSQVAAHAQCLTFQYSLRSGLRWFVSAVYGHPNAMLRSLLWSHLNALTLQAGSPWMLVGDFNDYAFSSEVLEDVFSAAQARTFNDRLNGLDLLDLGFSGPSFTWVRTVRGRRVQQRRIDRAVANINLSGETIVPLVRPFRFEAIWLSHPSYGKVVMESWRHNPSEQKHYLLGRLGGIQAALATAPSSTLAGLEAALLGEYCSVLAQEELFWYQKSRQQWIAQGDRCTRFYHLSTVCRRKRNKVERLKIGGQWCSQQGVICQEVGSHF